MRREAIRILPDIVRDEMIENDHTAIPVKVRDEDGRLSSGHRLSSFPGGVTDSFQPEHR
ncbi:DUF6894 family protein [Mesorhizobium sp. B4-1-4]|uniref:DUF6894 family protein n=1 Tax=Mesorhizobium sp. B4-1-4 TaxID=2589888 RepID=UPI001D02AD21|nr:hypothetical protein [Mesorhizobium sp. B4-1-4]UCI29979.1 hypothetical protein FJW03_19350 [Mesorhizobium sp. B4-1-4]